jgi:hypothetical protein
MVAAYRCILSRLSLTRAIVCRRTYQTREEKPRMVRKVATVLTIAVAVVFVLATTVPAAEFQGTVSTVDDKGMATIKATDGKEHKVQMTQAKAGDKVDCHVKDGKTSCHKLGHKHK